MRAWSREPFPSILLSRLLFPSEAMLGGEESGQAAAGGGAPVAAAAAASPATEAEAPALAVPAARDAEEKKDEEEDEEAEEEAAAAEAERATRQRYEELCSSLNMDERARAEAWLSYQSMRRNYTLEVGPRAGRGRACAVGPAR